MDLRGKTALVTGGTKGIGKAIAVALLNAGANVVVSSRTAQEVDAVANELSALGSAAGFVCDVRNEYQVHRLFENVVDKFKTVDLLINNAGIGIFGTVVEMSPDDFRAVIETNLIGVYYCCREAIPLMKQRGGGYIFNISSLAGANPHASMSAYNASKFGLNGFSEALMQELRHDGIKVSYIMPGSVNTDFGGDNASSENSWQIQPEDVAKVVIDLLGFPERTLPSRIEIRPTRPPQKK